MNRRTRPLVLFLLVLIAPNARAGLMMHLEVAQTGSEFTYTVFNDEPNMSSLYITAFHLQADGPFSVTNTPAGWGFFTDNSTYIDWFNTDPELPYPHDIAPGGSLSGFTLTSTVMTTELQPFTANSWDHATNTGGPFAQDSVPAPSGVAAVPEPSSVLLFGMGTLGLMGYYLAQKWQSCPDIGELESSARTATPQCQDSFATSGLVCEAPVGARFANSPD